MRPATRLLAWLALVPALLAADESRDIVTV